MNVKFYRLQSLPTFASANHTGIFVHLTTDQMSGDTVVHKAGLYFGGESNWEYLTNDTDPTAVQTTITNAINGLDVTGYAQASIAATQGGGSTITIKGIQEVDGKISEYSTSNTTILVDGAYDSGTNKIATQSTVTNALGTLNGSHDVVTISDYTPQTDENATKKIEFFDGTQTNGALGTSSVTDTLYLSQAVTAANPIITKGDLSGIVGAMVYRDSITYNNSAWSFGSSTTPASASQGDVYVVSTGFTLDGATALLGANVPAGTYEAGDTLIYTGSSWNVINGENQVTNNNATITAGAGASTLATVDGTGITAKVSITGGSATIATVSDGVVTITPTVAQGQDTGTIQAASGTQIVLDKVATTGLAEDVDFTVTGTAITPTGGSGTTATVQEAITQLDSRITNANITIDGHKGTITTGNGLTDVAADGGSFGIDIDSTNTNGLYLSGDTEGSKKLAMHIATGSQFGTVKVTTGNGLTLTDGVVAYAHNTTAITVASNSDGVVTINGTLTPDAFDAITASNSITLVKVATTGAAADVSYAGAADVTGSEPTTVEAALDDLYFKVSDVSEKHTTLTATQNNSVLLTTSTNGNGGTNYNIDLVWETELLAQQNNG